MDVFASQPWYLQEPAPEQEFSGLLEAIPASHAASALQRSAFYRLGERTVYTGTARPPALEGLAGQPVVIRGKAVELRLEGALVREIWPGSLRRQPAK